MYKALISFSGAVSMRSGETREISDQKIVKDLLNAGYIVEVGGDKKTKKRGASDEQHHKGK